MSIWVTESLRCRGIVLCDFDEESETPKHLIIYVILLSYSLNSEFVSVYYVGVSWSRYEG